MKKIIRKIKKSWQENRVLFVLTTILIICLILILIVGIDYFFGSSKDKYGERLEGINEVKFTDKKITELEGKINEDELITSCEINQIGKMIYVNINFGEGITLVEAEGKALATIEFFSEKELAFYDVNYTLKQEATESNPGFIIMGSKNVNGSGLIWNNNTPVTESEE